MVVTEVRGVNKMGFVVEKEHGEICTHGGSSHVEHDNAKAERDRNRRRDRQEHECQRLGLNPTTALGPYNPVANISGTYGDYHVGFRRAYPKDATIFANLKTLIRDTYGVGQYSEEKIVRGRERLNDPNWRRQEMQTKSPAELSIARDLSLACHKRLENLTKVKNAADFAIASTCALAILNGGSSSLVNAMCAFAMATDVGVRIQRGRQIEICELIDQGALSNSDTENSG